jgi:uroporphyrinogen-III synthase
MKAKSNQSLAGLRVLVGRARHQASALSAGLRELGAAVIEIPFIEIRKPRSYKPLDSALKHLDEYDWLILTSVNGVDAVWERTKKLKLGKRQFKHLQIAAIGPATSKRIEKHGLKVDVVPEEYVAESVVKSLRKQVKEKRVLLARASIARDVIPRELRKLGSQVHVVEAYETVIPKFSRLGLRAVLKDPKRRPDVITFTSSSTVKNFAALLGGPKATWRGHPHTRTPVPSTFDRIRFASIGPITSATLRELGLPVDIEAKEYTIPGLITAVACLKQGSRKRRNVREAIKKM